MISAGECREHAVECRQMSERAPSLRVQTAPAKKSDEA